MIRVSQFARILGFEVMNDKGVSVAKKITNRKKNPDPFVIFEEQ
jgi:hypothetical protein